MTDVNEAVEITSGKSSDMTGSLPAYISSLGAYLGVLQLAQSPAMKCAA